MTDDLRPADTSVPPVAWDETPGNRPLTRSELERIRDALAEFETALARGKPEGQPAADPDGQPSAGAHTLVVAGYLGPGYGPDDITTEEAVARACRRHFDAWRQQTGATADKVDGYPDEARVDRVHVILHSTGGSLDSAYRTMLYLRAYAKEIRVYVADRAKSAATLIAIGADRVGMSPFAELGPLDTQILDPRNPTRHVSALDCYLSVNHVREFGVATIPRALNVMLDDTHTRIPLGQILDSATAFATGSVRPMLEHVSALEFGGWGRTLRIGETYAKMLRLRLHRPDPENVARRLASQLVYGYPHHPYPIDRAEAVNLGISADVMPREVFEAAHAIATACRHGARFTGFAEDAAEALTLLAEQDDDGPRLPVGVTAMAGVNGSAQANAISADIP